MTELFPVSATPKPPSLDAPVDREAYRTACRTRWCDEPLRDALANFRHFEAWRPKLLEALLKYHADPMLEQPDGTFLNGDGHLTSYLWTLRSDFRRVVYWTKKHAILHAARAGLPVTLRLVRDIKKCRSCGGTGVWFSDYDHDREEGGEMCRTCRTTGRVVLKFIESTIDGDLRWHTPRDEWISSSLDVYFPFPAPEDDALYADTDWQANSPGMPQSRETVIQDMLTVLHQFPKEMTFIMRCQHRIEAQVRYNVPDLPVAERWIHERGERAKLNEFMMPATITPN